MCYSLARGGGGGERRAGDQCGRSIGSIRKRTKLGRRRPGFVTGEPFHKTWFVVDETCTICYHVGGAGRRGGDTSDFSLARVSEITCTAAENRGTSNKIVKRVKHRHARPSCGAQVIYHIANKMNRNTRERHVNARFPVSVHVWGEKYGAWINKRDKRNT